MVRTVYVVDRKEVSEEVYHTLRIKESDNHEFDCYCICLECGDITEVYEVCPCQCEEW